MRELTFNDLNKEKANNFSTILNWCNGDADDNLLIYFKDKQGNFQKKEFRDIAPQATSKYSHSLQAALVLAHFVFCYIKEHPRFSSEGTTYDYESYVLDYEYDETPKIDHLISVLAHLEKFLAELIYLIHPKEFSEKIENEKFGLFDIMHFQEKITDQYGFIDESLDFVSELAFTLRKYRNDMHATEKTDFLIPSERGSGKIRRYILNSITSFIILVIWYRYDDIFEALNDYIAKALPQGRSSEELSEEELESKAIDLLKQRYIPHLEIEQRVDLNAVYRFTNKTTDEEAKKEILHIRLKSFDKTAISGNEQGNDEEDYSKKSDEFENIEILDRADSKIALLGESGSGKTTMLSQLTMELIERWKQSGSDEVYCLPVRVNLTNFGALVSLLSLIRSSVLEGSDIHGEDAGIVWKYVEDLLKQGNVIVLLDGLNEMKGVFDEGWKQIRKFMEMYPDCKVIITSRIDDIRLQTHDLDSLYDVGFVVFQLCTLSNEDIKCQLKNALKVISGETSSANSWFESIKANESLEEMSKNPMQLMLLVNLLENGQEDSLESMNPSRLYDRYVGDMIKYEIVKRGERKTSAYQAERTAFDSTVKLIARMMGTEKKTLSQEDIKNEYLKTLDVDNGVTALVALFLEQIGTASKMGLLRTDKQGDLEFTHQSWIEFYRSMDFMEKIFVIMKDTNLTSDNEEERLTAVVKELLSFPFSVRAKYLKGLLELMEWREEINGPIGGLDRSSTIKCKFIMMILTYKGNVNSSDSVVLKFYKDADRLSVVEGAERLAIQEPLKLLAFATSALKYVTPKEEYVKNVGYTQYPLPPLYVVEASVLNAMYLYKQCFPSGEMDKKYLPDLFECAALCGTKRIADELCTPYWLKMWVSFLTEIEEILPNERGLLSDEHKMQYSDDKNDCKNLADILTSKFRHPMNLCELIVEEYVFLRCNMMSKTASQILGQLLRLYDRIDDRRLKKEHDRLKELASSSDGDIRFIYNTLAQYALFMMETPDLIISLFNPNIRIDIHRTAMNHLFEMSANEGIQNILLKTVYNYEKRKKGKIKDSTMRVLRFLLFSYPESNILHKFLWSKDNVFILKQNPELVDILPIDKIPEDFIKSNYDVDIFNMMMLQHQKKEGRYHLINDFRKTYADSIEEGTITGDRYDAFTHLFHPVTEDKIRPSGNLDRTKVAYSILGRPNNQTLVLSCEGLASGDKISNKYCRLEGVDQWFVVDGNSPASGFYAELRLSGISADLPYSGLVHFNLGEERQKFKYSYIIRGDEFFVIRVTDSDGLDILEQLYTRQDFMTHLEVIISKQVFKLHEICFYSYPNAQNNERTVCSLLRIRSINSDPSSNLPVVLAGGIPSSGYFSLFNVKNKTESPLPLKVNEISRGKKSQIKDAVFWGNNKGSSMFVIGNDQYISRGSYVKIESKKRIGRVNYAEHISGSWEVSFLLDGDIPDFGYIYFNDFGKRFHYWVQSVNGQEYRLAVFRIGRREFDIISYKDTIFSITIEDSEYEISNVSVRECLPHTYDMLWGMDGEMECTTGRIVTDNMQLVFYQPVINDLYSDFQIEEQPLYRINKVKYRYVRLEGHHVLVIPHYISERKKLYYKLGNDGRCQEVIKVSVSYQEKKRVATWDVDTILIPDGFNYRNRDLWEGFLYFYSDPKGVIPETVGIQYMSSLISENEPQRYHASICTRYLEECKEKGLGSPSIFRFFQRHNRSYEYLQYYLERSTTWRKSHGAIYPHVGCVVSSNMFGVIVFCPRKENLVKMNGPHEVICVDLMDYGRVGRIYTEYRSADFALQDIVVCEENHSLNHLRLRDDQRLDIFGYHKGIISKKFPDGSGFITSKSVIGRDTKREKPVVFFFVKSQQTLSCEVGDKVSFMPSVNLGGRHNGKPLAADVLKIGTFRRIAEITHIEESTDEKGNDMLIIIGTDVNTRKSVNFWPLKDNELLMALSKVKEGANVVYLSQIDRRGIVGYNARILEIIDNHE